MLVIQGGLLRADGTVKMAAALDFNGQKGVNVADGASGQDVAAFHQAGGGGGIGDIGARVFLTNPDTGPGSGFVPITWDTTDYDSGGISGVGGSHPTRLTVPTGQGGKYLIGAAVQAGSANTTVLAIFKNGTQVGTAVGGITGGLYVDISDTLALAAADYIEIAYENSPGSAGASSYAYIRRVA